MDYKMKKPLSLYANTLEGFKEWAIAIGHYPIVHAIKNFETYQGSLKNGTTDSGIGSTGQDTK